MARGSVVVVFGIGMLLVNLWCCVKTTEAKSDDGFATGASIHAVRRDEPEGCQSNHGMETGEECTDEDDHLGLYGDIDDTFRGAAKKVAAAFHIHEDHDDSPDIANNNVDVLGH